MTLRMGGEGRRTVDGVEMKRVRIPVSLLPRPRLVSPASVYPHVYFSFYSSFHSAPLSSQLYKHPISRLICRCTWPQAVFIEGSTEKRRQWPKSVDRLHHLTRMASPLACVMWRQTIHCYLSQ